MTVNKSSDAKLIEKYKSGDTAAFEELLYKYKNQIFSYILRMVKNKTVAEDIFQDVWVNTLKYLPRYDERNKFSGFLFKIAHSKTMDYLRKDRNFEELPENLPDNSWHDTTLREHPLEKAELYNNLNLAIENLPAKQKEILLLRQESDLSFKEIAKMLDCPINTVLSRMHNAVLSLRKIMKKEI